MPPVSLPAIAAVPVATLTPRQARTALARRTLAARGLAECVTFSFLARDRAALFGDAPEALRLRNPIASDLDQLRPSVIATLALAATRNAARGIGDLGLFEVGPAFLPDGERLAAAGLRAGQTPRHWAQPARDVDALDAKGDALAVLAALGVPGEALSVDRRCARFLPPRPVGRGAAGAEAAAGDVRRAASACAGGTRFARAGFGVRDFSRRDRRSQASAAVSPRSAGIPAGAARLRLRGGAEVPADAVLRAARGSDRALVAGVVLFDVYAGAALGEGRKSLGVEVTFQPRERTLTDAEIEAACARVVAAVAKATGAVLR